MDPKVKQMTGSRDEVCWIVKIGSEGKGSNMTVRKTCGILRLVRWSGLIEKNIFMENEITAREHLMSCIVIKFVGFLANWIAKKNTTFGSRCKFVRNMHISSITKIPEKS